MRLKIDEGHKIIRGCPNIVILEESEYPIYSRTTKNLRAGGILGQSDSGEGEIGMLSSLGMGYKL